MSSLLVLSCALRVFLWVFRFSSFHKNQPWFDLSCAPWPDRSRMAAVRGALVCLWLGHIELRPCNSAIRLQVGWLANPNLFFYLFVRVHSRSKVLLFLLKRAISQVIIRWVHHYIWTHGYNLAVLTSVLVYTSNSTILRVPTVMDSPTIAWTVSYFCLSTITTNIIKPNWTWTLTKRSNTVHPDSIWEAELTADYLSFT